MGDLWRPRENCAIGMENACVRFKPAERQKKSKNFIIINVNFRIRKKLRGCGEFFLKAMANRLI